MNNGTIFTDEEKFTDMSKIHPIAGKQYVDDPEVEKIAKKVIDDQNIEFGPALICYQTVYPNISKKTAARCKKTSPELKHFSGYDFLIQISGDLWDMLDEDTRYKLIFHELLHVDARFKAKNQEWKFKVRKHDYSDFYEINKKYGLEWYETVQATVSSLYDLDPRQENEVQV